MNTKKQELQNISGLFPSIPKSRLEEEGHSLLIVDLLRLPKNFSYRRYRLDLIGFGAAWLWVVMLLLLGYWLTRIGG
ncbi:MAG: hypothetical protein IPL01_21035 [Acidobacteria bacterium]|nr:hypothetical protein [Acidobacteriota bacterium]